MRRVVVWISSWFTTSSVMRRLSGSQQHLDRLSEQSRERAFKLETRARELDSLAKKIEQDLQDARRTNSRLENALQEVREQNLVLEKTIQTLVSSHELLISRYDAECAVEVRRRVAVSSRDSV